MAAEITFNQTGGAGAGSPGGRNDIWLSIQVDMVSSGTGSSWLWELLDAPSGSSATISNSTSSTANITPDVVGTYRIKLTIDGSESIIKVFRARYDNTGALSNRGWALPAIDEEEGEADYPGNTRHWAEVWESIIPDARQNITRTMVFKPGGTAGGNVYTDWADLMTAFAEVEGPVTILVDDSVSSPAEIPAGTYDLKYQVTFMGLKADLSTLLQIGDGSGATTVQNVVGFKNIVITASNHGAADVIESSVSSRVMLFENAALWNLNPTAALLQCQSGDALLFNGTSSTLSLFSAQPAITVTSGILTIQLNDFSSIADNTLDVASGTTINVDGSTTVATCSATQVGAGTLNITIPSTGGSFTAGGDLSGTSTEQTVSAIQGVSTPSSNSGLANGKVLKVIDAKPTFTTPRALITDGTYLYVGESSQDTPPGTAKVWKLSANDKALVEVGSIDLSTVVGAIDRVRDLAVDSTYLYATCWDTGHIAVIQKSDMTIVGWGYAGEATDTTPNRAISVCADDAGNFYVYVKNLGGAGGFEGVQKFSSSSCIGQSPGSTTATSTLATSTARWVRYWNSKVWLTNGGNGADDLSRIDPVTLTIEDSTNDDGGMSTLYAFGSIWMSTVSGLIYRYNPSTLVQEAYVEFAPNYPNLSELVVGPAPDGTPNSRIFVTSLNNPPEIGVIDPGTNTLESLQDPVGDLFSSFDGLALVGDYVWAASFLNNSGETVEKDLWYITPNSGSYTAGLNEYLVYDYDNSFTASGDLSGDDSAQTVSAIHGVTTPAAGGIVDRSYLKAADRPYFDDPRTIEYDGTYIWTADLGTSVIMKIDPTTEQTVAYWDMSAHIANGIRDLSFDDSYLYVSGWEENAIAIMDKVSGEIVGWASTAAKCLFVAVDKHPTKKLWATVDNSTVEIFIIANCIGQEKGAKTYDYVVSTPNQGRSIRYADTVVAYMLISDPKNNFCYKIHYNTRVLTSIATPHITQFISYGFGYAWASSYAWQEVYKINLGTNSVDATITIGTSTKLFNITVGPDTSGNPDTYIWVGDWDGGVSTPGHVYGINPATDSFVATLTSPYTRDFYEGLTATSTHVFAMSRFTDVAGKQGVRKIDPQTSTFTDINVGDHRSIRYAISPGVVYSSGVAGALTAGGTNYALTNLTESATPLPQLITRGGGLIRRLKIRLGTAPGTGESVQVVVLQNGSLTPVTATISGTAQEAEDITNTEEGFENGRLDFRVINSNNGSFAAANLSISVEVG